MDNIQRALRTVRTHLEMDVAFVSEFAGDHRVLHCVDTKDSPALLAAGQSISQRDGYCLKVAEGVLPALIPDTSKVPEAMAIAATREIPIGAHISVPLLLADGQVYGTFCCFSFAPDETLTRRDLAMMRIFADMISQQINGVVRQIELVNERRDRVRHLIDAGEPGIAYQPCLRLSDMMVVGAEALARFRQEPHRTPDAWFREAAEVGQGVELELQAIRNALDGYRNVWQRAPIYLGINASPETVLDGRLAKIFAGHSPDFISLEITEHNHVEDYAALNRALAPLRALGISVAVDDAGSGYASMRHILNLRPDTIKLDIALTRDIDLDSNKKALAAAIIAFGREIGTRIVAEGVETEAELQTLRQLGAFAAQGYLLGRPGPIEDLEALLHRRTGSLRIRRV